MAQGAGVQALEEIVVTAERRTSDVQKTAASVTVRTGDELVRQGKFSLGDVIQNVPGISGGASSGVGNSGTDTIANGVTIRGVASNAGPVGQNLSGVPATAIFVDDVYNGLGGTYDIERVEVLRGPQGTLYGRSATAGVIAIHTRDPDLSDLGGEITAELGSYAQRRLEAVLNVPIVDEKLALRVAANRYERDGFDSAEGGRVETTDVKAKLLFQPTENVSVLVGAALQDNTTHTGGVQASLSPSNAIVFSPWPLGEGKNNFRQVWAQVDWNLGAATLTYLPALRTWEQDALTYVTGPGGAPLSQKQTTPDDDFVTHELRLASNGDKTLTWQTGIFYYYNDISTSNHLRWASSNAAVVLADARRETKDIGVFGEATYHFGESLRLTAGLRYDETTVQTNEVYGSNINLFAGSGPTAGLPEFVVSASVSGAQGRRDFQNTTYKLRLEYDVTPDNLVYGAATSGFLPGDVQISVGAGNIPTPSVYEAETLKAYELGSKNRFLGNRLQINGSIYFYDYGGYQLSITSDPSNPGSTAFYSVPMRMTGGELELAYQLTDAIRIGLNASRTEAEFVDATPAFRAVVSQSELWGFPPTTATLFYDHGFELSGGSSLAFHGEANYRSSYMVDSISPANRALGGSRYLTNEEMTLVNLSLTWTSENADYAVSGYVRNLTDERYKGGAQLQSISPLLATVSGLSDPQTWGVVLKAKF